MVDKPHIQLKRGIELFPVQVTAWVGGRVLSSVRTAESGVEFLKTSAGPTYRQQLHDPPVAGGLPGSIEGEYVAEPSRALSATLRGSLSRVKPPLS